MYKELILDLYKNPKNYGTLPKKTTSQRLLNPLCGDDITIELLLENDIIKDISFHGPSCAICRASASLLTDYAKGKNLKEVVQLDAGAVKEIVGIDISPGRIKCLLLPLEVLKKTP